MTVATHRSIHLSVALQNLIDGRLDTIDRMLLGRVARSERMAIVRDVESQVHELLAERETDELTREDVLAVLARLDPPEAYLPEDFAGDQPPTVRQPVTQPAPLARHGNHRVARTSSILGFSALGSVVVLLVSYAVAAALNSYIPLALGGAVSAISLLTCSPLGIALGIYSRRSGVWAFVGIVTSVLALLLSVLVAAGVFLLA
jgi:hypothetical protein